MDHLPADERIFVIVESGGLGFWGGGVQIFSNLDQGRPTPARQSTARYQIVVRKQDLTEATTAEALKGKIEETEY